MTTTDTTWPCCNCTKPVRWSTALDGWEHAEGGQDCDETGKFGAAPGWYPRCAAYRLASGGQAVCDRPAGGHTEHSASAAYRLSTGADVKLFELLNPPLHWTTP